MLNGPLQTITLRCGGIGVLNFSPQAFNTMKLLMNPKDQFGNDLGFPIIQVRWFNNVETFEITGELAQYLPIEIKNRVDKLFKKENE